MVDIVNDVEPVHDGIETGDSGRQLDDMVAIHGVIECAMERHNASLDVEAEAFGSRMVHLAFEQLGEITGDAAIGRRR